MYTSNVIAAPRSSQVVYAAPPTAVIQPVVVNQPGVVLSQRPSVSVGKSSVGASQVIRETPLPPRVISTTQGQERVVDVRQGQAHEVGRNVITSTNVRVQEHRLLAGWQPDRKSVV